MGDRGQREAFVTLSTNDTYSIGCIVLANSIRRAGTTRQLVVMITSTVSQEMRNQLAAVFDLVQDVDVLDSRDTGNLGLLGRPDLGVTFTKLHCWRLTQFDKCVFLDADTLVLQNVDELFDREEISAAPDAGWPDCFNSGVYVFRPSEETYQSLLSFALTQGSFDGGDQGLLNMYFSDWATKDIAKHLPFIYNVVSQAFYSYLPAFTQFKDRVKIIHFIGEVKPWHQPYNTATGRVSVLPGSGNSQEFLQLWWDIFMDRVQPVLSSALTLSYHPVCELLPSPDVQVTKHDSKTNLHEHSSYKVLCPYIPPSVEAFYESPVLTINPHLSDSINIEKEKINDRKAGAIEHFSSDAEINNTSEYMAALPSDNLDVIRKVLNEKPLEPQIIIIENDAGRPYVPLETHYSEEPMTNINAHRPPEVYSAGKFEQKFSIKENGDIIESDSDTEIIKITDRMQNINKSGLPGGTIHPLVPSQNVNSESDICEVLPNFGGGLVGQLATMKIDGTGRTMGGPVVTLDDRQRKLAWEQGRIDYLGSDSFENIQRKLDQTIAQAKEKSKSPEPAEKPAKSPSPPKVAEQPAEVKAEGKAGGQVSETEPSTVEVVSLSTDTADAAVSGITVEGQEEKPSEPAVVVAVADVSQSSETDSTQESSATVTVDAAQGAEVTPVSSGESTEVSETITLGGGEAPKVVDEGVVASGEPDKPVDIQATSPETEQSTKSSMTLTLAKPDTAQDVSPASGDEKVSQPASTESSSEVQGSVSSEVAAQESSLPAEPVASTGEVSETINLSVSSESEPAPSSTEASETISLAASVTLAPEKAESAPTADEPAPSSTEVSETISLAALVTPAPEKAESSPTSDEPVSSSTEVSETISLAAPVTPAPEKAESAPVADEPAPSSTEVSETISLAAPVTPVPEKTESAPTPDKPAPSNTEVSETISLGAPVTPVLTPAPEKVESPPTADKPASSTEVSQTITLGTPVTPAEIPTPEKPKPVPTPEPQTMPSAPTPAVAAVSVPVTQKPPTEPIPTPDKPKLQKIEPAPAEAPKAATSPPVAPKPSTTTQAFAKFVKGEVVEPAVSTQSVEPAHAAPSSKPTPVKKSDPVVPEKLEPPSKPRPTSPASPAAIAAKTFGASMKDSPPASKPAPSFLKKKAEPVSPVPKKTEPVSKMKPEPKPQPEPVAKPQPAAVAPKTPAAKPAPEPTAPKSGFGAKPSAEPKTPSKPGLGAKPPAEPKTPFKPGFGVKPPVEPKTPPRPSYGAKPSPPETPAAKPASEPTSKPGLGSKATPPQPKSKPEAPAAKPFGAGLKSAPGASAQPAAPSGPGAKAAPAPSEPAAAAKPKLSKPAAPGTAPKPSEAKSPTSPPGRTPPSGKVRPQFLPKWPPQ